MQCENFSEYAILMCVFDGERYLSPQLSSINAQTETGWSLYVSDDGSSDHSLAILKEFQEQIGDSRVKLRQGPGKGFAKNFISLIMDPAIEARYYVLSDQDDIWDEEKLAAAKAFLDNCNPQMPALYCGKTIFVDEEDKAIGLSSTPSRPLIFKNALVQNIASGNTMIINGAARKLLIKCGPVLDVYAHDWLIYMLVSGADGVTFYDERPYVRYRQHGKNQIGMNSKFIDKIKRFGQLLSGEFSNWNKRNIETLQKNCDLLTKENVRVLNTYGKASRSWGIVSLYNLAKSGVYRQRLHQSVALYLGAALGRL